jgi:hypothetical protein
MFMMAISLQRLKKHSDIRRAPFANFSTLKSEVQTAVFVGNLGTAVLSIAVPCCTSPFGTHGACDNQKRLSKHTRRVRMLQSFSANREGGGFP